MVGPRPLVMALYRKVQINKLRCKKNNISFKEKQKKIKEKKHFEFVITASYIAFAQRATPHEALFSKVLIAYGHAVI